MLDYKDCIHEFLNPSASTVENVEYFFSNNSNGNRYILGRNSEAKQLAELIDVTAFVDDFADIGTRFCDKPVVCSQDISHDGVVVNCAMSISPVSAEQALYGLGLSRVVSYSDLCRVLPEMVPLPRFVCEFRDDFQLHETEYRKIYAGLVDLKSKQVFSDVIRYRLTADVGGMKSYTVRTFDQYFDGNLLFDNAVFIDAGGFDGDTSEEVCKRHPTYKKIILFEPSRLNIAEAKMRLSSYLNIEYMEFALSDKAELLPFNPDAGSACSVADSATDFAQATTLDSMVKEPVTIIKMDLEGWEFRALHGAKNHILRDHPALAIAVYHCAEDFRRIYNYVLDIRQDYDVHLRHYTEGWSETIMFFIPR